MSLFQVTKKQVIENYELRTMTGDIVSFAPSYSQLLPDPFSDLNVKVNVLATQSGSGTPYPPGGGKNKFDKTAVTSGRLINGSGNEVAYANWSVSDYIPVTEGASYYLYGLTTHPNTLQDNFELFDSSKTKTGFANVRTNEYPWTIPSGTKYVKFSLNDSDLNTAMFATSEGEYEPYSNVRPINGYSSANITRCGVNLWDEEWEIGSINASGVDTPDATRIRTKNYITVKPSTTYYFKSSKQLGLRFYDATKTGIGYDATQNSTFTIPSGCYYLRFTVVDTTTYGNDISVNYPATDTTYHAYNGQTYAIAFGQTVYGGVLDVTRGKLTVTHQILEKSVASMNNAEAFPGWHNSGIRALVGAGLNVTYFNQILNIGTEYSVNTNGSNDELYLRIATYGLTQSQWITQYPDLIIQICVKLATPFDIDLTPVQIRALVGENNVFADCGETTVTCLI